MPGGGGSKTWVCTDATGERRTWVPQAGTSSGTAIVSMGLERLRTDKDTHFTEAIAQNAKEDENITGLAANKVLIRGVMIQADENLAYRALFWSKDSFDDTDLDADTFLGAQALDIPTNGWRIAAANQYYYYTDAYLSYQDDDETNELHVSLQCLTAGGKAAGANGEVVLEVIYEVCE